MWVWLPGATEPMVAGVLERGRGELVFQYAPTYLERAERIPLYLPELPLGAELITAPAGWTSSPARTRTLPADRQSPSASSSTRPCASPKARPSVRHCPAL
ncbi:MAG: hypothetical protein ACYCYA_00505 [Actinomycetes bacterium]